ncbi:ABC transporter permease [Dactylosporangium sp. CA-092794]|uniref:ABC transporter permease n=1 Tax=Dactylosporangium sp. CA-092794 TaxID=3239929 RepID=UPI003D91253C
MTPSLGRPRRRLRFTDPVRRRRAGLVSAVLLLLLVVAAVLAPLIAPHNPTGGELADTLRPPVWAHDGSWRFPLGTDSLGRDELSRLIYGARVSLLVGLVAAVIAGVVGVPLGLFAGYLGGRADTVVAGVVNIMMAFPFLLLALLVAGVTGPGLRNVLLILGLTGWPMYTRVIRSVVLELRERTFVTNARVMGLSHPRVMFRHVLPGVWPTFLVITSLQIGHMILAEAFLSFLGLGIQPPTPTWGGMLSEGRSYIYTQWWLTAFPGIAMLVTVLCVNLLSDSIRDALASARTAGEGAAADDPTAPAAREAPAL